MKERLVKILMWKLRVLARATIRRYQPGVVAVTGSVGKTSTKEAIAAVVAEQYGTRAAAKSFNNEIGVPLTILGEWEGKTHGPFFWVKVFLVSVANLIVKRISYPEVLVLEYAIDRPGDMDRLVALAAPNVAVMTAIGDVPVHVEFFEGPEAVLHEKAKLLKALNTEGFAVLNADDEKVLATRDMVKGRIVTFGFSEKADVRIVQFKNHLEERTAAVHLKLSHEGNVVPVRIEGALGRAEGYAAAAAAAVGRIFGMNLVEIAGALEKYVPPPGRSRVLRGLKGTIFIDSTYNASPLAMEEALTTLAGIKAERTIAILGDMLEIGNFTLSAHEALGVRAAKSADVLVTIGLRGKFIAEAALAHGMPKRSVHSFLTLEDAARFLDATMKSGDLILFKASQGVRLERLVKRFLAEPARAGELLVRQDEKWLGVKGLYDEGELG